MEMAACCPLTRLGRSDGRAHWGGLKRPGGGPAPAEFLHLIPSPLPANLPTVLTTCNA